MSDPFGSSAYTLVTCCQSANNLLTARSAASRSFFMTSSLASLMSSLIEAAKSEYPVKNLFFVMPMSPRFSMDFALCRMSLALIFYFQTPLLFVGFFFFAFLKLFYQTQRQFPKSYPLTAHLLPH